MQLSTLRFTNFRGGSFSSSLSPVTLLIGKNGIGKSRIIQAIQLAIRGAVPNPTEEKNLEPVELFTKDFGKQSIDVELGCTDGTTIARAFDLTKKGDSVSVGQTVTINQTPLAMREGDRQIKELLGDFDMMLDLNKFVRLSDEGRAELFMRFGQFDASKWTQKHMTERIVAVYSKEAKGGKPEAVSKLMELAFASAPPAIKGDMRKVLIQLIDWTKKTESDTKKEIKTYSATSQGTVSLNAMDGKTSLRPIEVIEAEITKLGADKDNLSKTVEAARASKKEYDKLQAEKKDIEEKQKAGENEASLDAKIAECSAEIEKLKTPEVFSDLLKLNDLNEKYNARERQNGGIKSGITQLQTTIGMLTQQYEAVKGGTCPVCTQQCDPAIADGFLKTIGASDKAIEFFEKTRSENEIFLMNLEGEIEILSIAKDQIAFRNQSAPSKIKSLEQSIESFKAGKQHIKMRADRLAYIETVRTDNPINIDEAELQLGILNTRLTDLRSEQGKRIEYNTRLEQVKESAVKMKSAENKLEAVQIIKEELKSMRREIVRESLEKIEVAASTLFSHTGILAGGASFAFRFEDDNHNERFQFGWKTTNDIGEVFKDFDILSDSEKMFTLASIMPPLINLGNPKCRVLMFDNCEKVDEKNRPAFYKLLLAAQQVFLDNVIVALGDARYDALTVMPILDYELITNDVYETPRGNGSKAHIELESMPEKSK